MMILDAVLGGLRNVRFQRLERKVNVSVWSDDFQNHLMGSATRSSSSRAVNALRIRHTVLY